MQKKAKTSVFILMAAIALAWTPYSMAERGRIVSITSNSIKIRMEMPGDERKLPSQEETVIKEFVIGPMTKFTGYDGKPANRKHFKVGEKVIVLVRKEGEKSRAIQLLLLYNPPPEPRPSQPSKKK